MQSFALEPTLSLVPAPLLLAALLSAISAFAPRPKAGKREARLAALCASAAVLSFIITVLHLAELAALPVEKGYLFCHLVQIVRIGSLDVSLALALDPLVAPLLFAVSAVGTAVLVVVAITARHRPEAPTALAGSSLLVAAMQTMLLASGFFLLLLAWSAVIVAGVVLLGPRAVSAAGGVAQLLLVAAAALLFWLYGGRWQDGKYAPALRPRVIAVQAGAAASGSATTSSRAGQLSLRALAGTRIGLGAAELCSVDASGRPGGIGLSARPCREPARSPFERLPVPAAIHDFHLFTGHGTDELVVEKVRIEAGREKLFLLLGPTLEFRELFDQLSLREAAAETVESTLKRSELSGLPAFPLAVLLIVLAAATKLARVPETWSRAVADSSPSARALASGLAAVAGVYLVARLDFLTASAPGIAAFACLLGCAVAVRSAASALAETDQQRSTLLVAVAHGGVAFGGVAGGAAESGVLYLALASSAASAFALAESRARFFSALALSAAPLPALGAMLHRVSTEEAARYLPGALLAVMLAAASTMVTFTVWCSYYRASGRTAKSERPAAAGRHAGPAGFLAVLTLAGGMIVGYRLGFDQFKVALVAILLPSLYGWAAARRRYAASATHQPTPLLGWRWLGSTTRSGALNRWTERSVDSINAQLLRIERVLYAPLWEAKRPAEPRDGDR